MAEETKEAAAATTEAPDSGGGGGKLISILSVLNLVISIGMASVLFITFKKERTQPSVEDIVANEEEHGGGKEGEAGGHGEKKAGGHGESKAAHKDFGKMISLEQFTVNLSTPGSSAPKFIRVSISLEVPNEDTEAEVNLKMPQVRNVIIDLFNSKRPADLANPEGRDYLKEEIKNALNGFMITGKVKGVFFTGFAVSS